MGVHGNVSADGFQFFQWTNRLGAKAGFESFLHFSGLCNIDDIFIWLVNHFDTSTPSIELENGFSFPITPLTIHTILGIPLGGFPIQMKATRQSCDFIRQDINMETPFVEYLFSLVSENLKEDKFCRVFMLLVLSVFIAPKSQGVVSKKFYTALVDIKSIAKHDWCLFTISYLVYSINKAQIEINNGKDIFPRGCKLALVASHCKMILNVISYFEFLLAPGFSIPNSLPRLPLWTKNLLNSYMALDALQGTRNQFGRLPLKHITSTPFNDGTSAYSCKLPEEVQLHIESSFETISQTQDKMIIELKAKQFFQKCVQNTLPTIKTCIDDIMFASSMNNSCSSLKSAGCIAAASTSQQGHPNIPVSSSVFKVPHSKPLMAQPVSHELCNYDMILPEPTIFTEIENPFNLEEMFEDLIHGFSTSIELTNSDFTSGFENKQVTSYEENCFPQRLELPKTEGNIITVNFQQILEGFYNELKATSKLKNNNNNNYSTKFSFQHLRFLLPGEKLEEVEDASAQTILPSSSTWGLTINERIPPVEELSEYDEHQFPSFDAITNCIDEPLPQVSSFGKAIAFGSGPLPLPNMLPTTIQSNTCSTSQVYKDAKLGVKLQCHNNISKNYPTPITDTILVQALDQHEAHYRKPSEAGGSNRPQMNMNANFAFGKTTLLAENRNTFQNFFSTKIQNEFYNLLIGLVNKLDFSPRIFELEKIWVDQRTITLSMMPGGWINPRVINCFAKLSNKDQLLRGRQGLLPNNELIKHIVSIEDMDKLMNPMLNHSDPSSKAILHESHVGFNLLNASVVHLPGYFNKQWILIVANFIDKTFDVLNPDFDGDKFITAISTVTYNFKMIFAANYPNCRTFNIKNFECRFIQVPKCNFRMMFKLFEKSSYMR